MPAMSKFNSQAIIFLLSWSSSLRPYRNNIMIIQLWPLWTTLTVDPGSWTTVFRNQGTPRQTRMSNTLLKIVDWWSSGFQIFWSVLLLRYCSTFYINFEHSFQKEIINATNVTIIEPSDGITDGHISVPLLDHRDPWQGIWNAHLKIIMVMIIKIMMSIDHWTRSLLWSSFYRLWLANSHNTPRLYTRQIVMVEF